jgi:hypothetical protein
MKNVYANAGAVVREAGEDPGWLVKYLPNLSAAIDGLAESLPEHEPRIDPVRTAWNGYVFARAGKAPGLGMPKISEPEAFDILSAAVNAFLDGWE